jgi:hypothetical protein
MDRATFVAEGDRLLAIADQAGVTLRLLGALAFAKRCPVHAHLQERLGRQYTDIDFAGYGVEADRVRALLAGEGYLDDAQVYVDSEGSRLVAEHPGTGLHLDVFLDKLDFCHTVSFKGRLQIDPATIPLAEMLMQKMQIVQINEKDLIDTIMLLLEHPLGDSDADVVNIERVAEVCSRDWGWWRTLTMNLRKVEQMATSYDQLSYAEKRRISEQVATALARVDSAPKSVSWRLRAKVGDRKKWYKDVGELTPAVEE